MAAIQKPKQQKKHHAKAGVTKVQAEKFLSGLFAGLVQEGNLKDIQACMADDEEVATQVSEALAYFDKKTLGGILAGIKAIGDLLPSIPKDVQECRAMKSDVERIEKWASILKQPIALVHTVGKNVRKNFVTILQDIASGAKDLSQGDSAGAGGVVADIMIQALGPVPEAETEDEEESFVDQIDEVDIDSFADGNKSSEEIMAALMQQMNNQKKGKSVKAMLMLI